MVYQHPRFWNLQDSSAFTSDFFHTDLGGDRVHKKALPPPFPSSSSWPVSLPLPPGRFGLLSGQLLHGLRTLRRNIMSGPANAVNAVNPHQSDMLNPMPVGSLGTLTNLGAPVFVFLSPQAHVPWQVLTTGFINTLVHCRVRCTRDPRRQ